jgi:hypothetical protein
VAYLANFPTNPAKSAILHFFVALLVYFASLVLIAFGSRPNGVVCSKAITSKSPLSHIPKHHLDHDGADGVPVFVDE